MTLRLSSPSSAAQMFLVIPLALYLTERLYRWLWPAFRITELLDAELLSGPEPLIHLRVKRPISFIFRCGLPQAPSMELYPPLPVQI